MLTALITLFTHFPRLTHLLVAFLGLWSCSNSQGFESGKLLLWTRADGSLPVLRAAAQRFTTRTGITIEVTSPPGMLDRFQLLVESGQGPDMLIWAHDRVGEWSEMGLIKAIKPKVSLQKRISPMAWQGFTFNQKIMGYPLALESPTLIVNPKWIPVPPRRFEDIPALESQLSKQGVKALLWEYTNAYYSWSMLSAGAKPEPINRQLEQSAILKNLHWLEHWFASGMMARGTDYIDMERGFNQGKVAMMISGPWAWDNLQRSKTPFILAPLPTLNGQRCLPFVGVTGMVVANRTPNEHLLRKFIEEEIYSNQTQLELFNAGGMRGVPADVTIMRQLYRDPLLRQQYQILRGGVVMPNTPEMRLFWSTVGTALFNLGLGRQTAEEAHKNMIQRMKPSPE